jgi:ubiquinone/menaquinone biosynthesis C-methylase UbiE
LVLQVTDSLIPSFIPHNRYAFHEIPGLGRYKVLREVRRVLKEGGTLALIDISPDYNPSPTMLAGEPYVLEYKQNIQKQMISTKGFTFRQYKEIVPGHVVMWLLTREKQVPLKSK